MHLLCSIERHLACTVIHLVLDSTIETPLTVAGNPLCADKRRKWCDIPKNLAGKQFSPDHVYTFHIWQHLIDFSTYKANLGGLLNLDLTTFLNCQPLQLTCKDTSADEYMFSMLVWHEKLLYPDTSSSTVSSLAEKLGKFSFGFGRKAM